MSYLKEELLAQFFNIDVSGNQTDGFFDYYRRVNPEMITKKHPTEFEYIMDILIPTWREDDKSLLKLKHVEHMEGQMCICTKEISDICVFTHPSIPKGLQIGNACVEKIDKNLAAMARRKQKILKDKRKKEEEKRRLFRECVTCHKYDVPITEPSYKDKCITCYYNPPKKRLTQPQSILKK